MKLDRHASDSQKLVYRKRARPILGVILAALGMFMLLGFVVSNVQCWLNSEPLFGGHGFQSYVWGLVLQAALVVFGLKLLVTRRLVFDKALGTITKSSTVFFWGPSNTYQLAYFDTVSWDQKVKQKEEGKVTCRSYPVTLTGPQLTLDLFEESELADARQTTREISDFLGLENRCLASEVLLLQMELESGTEVSLNKAPVLKKVRYAIFAVLIVLIVVLAGESNDISPEVLAWFKLGLLKWLWISWGLALSVLVVAYKFGPKSKFAYKSSPKTKIDDLSKYLDLLHSKNFPQNWREWLTLLIVAAGLFLPFLTVIAFISVYGD